MTRSHRKPTPWKGALLAVAFLFTFALGVCSNAAACGHACDCDDRGDRGLVTSGLSCCGSEVALYPSTELRPIQKCGATVLAASREVLSLRTPIAAAGPCLRDRATAKPDALYLLHDSLLI